MALASVSLRPAAAPPAESPPRSASLNFTRGELRSNLPRQAAFLDAGSQWNYGSPGGLQ